MPHSLRTLTLAVVALLGLSACQQVPAEPTPREIALGSAVEQARAHLANARDDARLGRWDLAAVHAAHPAERMPSIDAALAAKDPAADARLRRQLAAAVSAAQSRDLAAVEAAVTEADGELSRVTATVMGDRASDVLYRASVLATIVDAIAEDYGEGVSGTALANETEYQDAYAFLQRALSIWADIEQPIARRAADEHEQVAAQLALMKDALPSLAPPATLVAAERVDAMAKTAQDELHDAIGARRGGATVADADTRLAQAIAAIDRGDLDAATTEVAAFREAWPDIEGTVKVKSPSAYTAIENDANAAASRLARRPADAAGARAAVAAIRDELAPFVEAPATYGVFDAAIILLREGFEALLVVAALLAFLSKSGNGDKRGWIWAGGGVGVAASVVVAIVVNVGFSASTAAGANREILEGVTGLFAAAMLVYVSYWMHSKANLASWQRYIREKSSSALARNSLLSLALISFLAVFREGAETALFYLGIAPSIALGDLALGLALGTGGLAVIGVAVLVFGVRVPIRPFFLVTSLLVYYLAFKFIGAGIHALQVAGIVPATSGSFLPDVGFFGMFPTWETTVVQLALLGAAVALILYERRGAPPQGVPAG